MITLTGVEDGKKWEEYYKSGKIKKGVAKGKIKGKWGTVKNVRVENGQSKRTA